MNDRKTEGNWQQGQRTSTRDRQYNRDTNTVNAESYFSDLKFKASWITTEADEEMIPFAEKAGEFMAKNGLTNSKIRSIYGEIKRIQMGEFEKEKAAFYLLKPKVAYALGREKNNEGLKLFNLVFNKVSTNVTNKKSYINFCNLIEAILAYHKFYGGKD